MTNIVATYGTRDINKLIEAKTGKKDYLMDTQTAYLAEEDGQYRWMDATHHQYASAIYGPFESIEKAEELLAVYSGPCEEV